MKPPYKVNPEILKSITAISEKLGAVKAHHIDKPSPKLRKENKMKTIHASLKIEGNTLTERQVTTLLENKRIIGPKKDVKEVLNAIDIYNHLENYDPLAEKSFLKCHRTLMNGLMEDAGKYRNQDVGIMKGAEVEHFAPPKDKVPFLMKNLFRYVKESEEITLIKSCVFHYEMEFIHPFLDGNGRMGRLWQTLLLTEQHPVFEYLPFENLISRDQEKYYGALSKSDKLGHSTPFIEYMLEIIEKSIDELLRVQPKKFTKTDRLNYFISLNKSIFTRKDYRKVFKDISAATASRDLKKGVELGLFKKIGEKNKTQYKLKY